MTRLVPLLALWLAAIWLPLTMHCELAGLMSCDEAQTCCEGVCGCRGGGDCHRAVCNVTESGNYLQQSASLLVPATSWLVIGAIEPAARQRLTNPVAILTAATGAPPGWTRIWQFVLRAAPAPRAPAALC